MLLEAFPHARLLGIDLAEDALAVAADKYPRARFLHADAESFQAGVHDLITANAVFQWFANLPGTLGRMAAMLAPGGVLSFSYFGPETYRELDAACGDVPGVSARVASRRFAGKETLADILRATFARWELEEVILSHTFPTLKALLESIRHTRAVGQQPARACWTPGRFARVEAAYRARCGTLHASYQVILCKGWR
jgi:malonyl-CoA O-methyltransferase